MPRILPSRSTGTRISLEKVAVRQVARWLRRPVVNSFDVFDTLISRRVTDPKAVFDIVGERACAPNYAEQRSTSEDTLWKSNKDYTIDTIYSEMRIKFGLTAAEIDNLKQLELEVELAQVIPITENLSLIRDGDVLVSDTYLDREFILGLLARAGLQRKIHLVVSAHGKRLGTIWPSLKSRYRIKRHLGDNWRSDRASPRAAWIRSRITNVSAATAIETGIAALGLPTLAAACREARLATWSDKPLHRSLQLVQADCNFPLLALASVALLRVCQSTGASHVLFCSRDCNLWQHVFAKIGVFAGQAEITHEYFYTSRTARLRCSPDYARYAAERIGPRSVVADIAGTGLSLAHLCAALHVPNWRAYYIHKMPAMPDYEQAFGMPGGGDERYSVNPDTGTYRNWVFEACNYADHASITDVVLKQNQPNPVYESGQDPPDVAAAIAIQRAAFLRAVDTVDGSVVTEMMRLSADGLRDAISAVYTMLSEQEAPRIAFKPFHASRDRQAMEALGLTLGQSDQTVPLWRRAAARTTRRA